MVVRRTDQKRRKKNLPMKYNPQYHGHATKNKSDLAIAYSV